MKNRSRMTLLALAAYPIACLVLSMAVRAETLADPMRPMQAGAVRAARTMGPLRVEAILSSGTRMLAIVNGKVVHAGDFIGNVRIDEILRDGVRYTLDGTSRVARLDQFSVRVRGGTASQKDEP